MRSRRQSLGLILVLASLMSATSVASAPLVAPGACETILGPGAVAPEVRTRIRQGLDCVPGQGGGQVNTSTLRAAAWVDGFIGTDNACEHEVAIGAEFTTEGDEPVGVSVTVSGELAGQVHSNGTGAFGRVTLVVELVELLPSGLESIVATEVLHSDDINVEFSTNTMGGPTLTTDGPFARTLEAAYLRAGTYRVYGVLTLSGRLNHASVRDQDYGLTPDRGLRLHAIDVCLASPPPFEDITARLDAIDAELTEQGDQADAMEATLDVLTDQTATLAADVAGLDADVALVQATADEILALLQGLSDSERDLIEWKLYQKDCVPSLWLPSSQGGRLDEARALVTDLALRAIASGDPGVNGPVAQARLAASIRAEADGEYQRSCRLLSDALRGLTTP